MKGAHQNKSLISSSNEESLKVANISLASLVIIAITITGLLFLKQRVHFLANEVYSLKQEFIDTLNEIKILDLDLSVQKDQTKLISLVQQNLPGMSYTRSMQLQRIDLSLQEEKVDVQKFTTFASPELLQNAGQAQVQQKVQSKTRAQAQVQAQMQTSQQTLSQKMNENEVKNVTKNESKAQPQAKQPHLVSLKPAEEEYAITQSDDDGGKVLSKLQPKDGETDKIKNNAVEIIDGEFVVNGSLGDEPARGSSRARFKKRCKGKKCKLVKVPASTKSSAKKSNNAKAATKTTSSSSSSKSSKAASNGSSNNKAPKTSKKPAKATKATKATKNKAQGGKKN